METSPIQTVRIQCECGQWLVGRTTLHGHDFDCTNCGKNHKSGGMIKLLSTVPEYPSAALVFKCSCGFQHELQIIDARKPLSFEFPCHVCGNQITGVPNEARND